MKLYKGINLIFFFSTLILVCIFFVSPSDNPVITKYHYIDLDKTVDVRDRDKIEKNNILDLEIPENLFEENINFLENNSETENQSFTSNATNNNKTKIIKKKNNKTDTKIKLFFKYRNNNTNIDSDIRSYKDEENKWNFKELSNDISSMLDTFINLNSRLKNKYGKIWLTKILIRQFEECDLNRDNIISLEEFRKCVNSQKYFNVLMNVSRKYKRKIYTNQMNLKKIFMNKEQNYLDIIYNIINESNNRVFNIYDYVKFRQLMIILKKCQSRKFFFSKIEFVCIAEEFDNEGFTKKENTLSRIYKTTRDFSRYQSYNDLDFINALNTFYGINLFGKINKNHVYDTLKKENFIIALNNNELPKRYNEKIIEIIFSELIKSKEMKTGIDIHTFLFIDRFIRIFHDNSSKFRLININENFIDLNGFLNCFRNYLFPVKYLRLFQINLKEYDVKNITLFEVQKEHNFIPQNLKENVEMNDIILLQEKEKENENKINKQVIRRTITRTTRVIRSKKTGSGSSSSSSVKNRKLGKGGVKNKAGNKNGNKKGNETSTGGFKIPPPGLKIGISRLGLKNITKNFFNNNKTNIDLPKYFDFYLEKFFEILYLKIEEKELVGLDDFLYLMQFMYIYPKTLPKHNLFNDNIQLFEYISQYSDYPLISYKFHERNNNLKKLKANTIFDFYISFIFFSYEDILNKLKIQRANNVNILSKNELLSILRRFNFINVPDFFFKKCFHSRDNSISQLPNQYDVICIINLTIEYIGHNLNNLLFNYHRYNTIITKK